VRSRSPSPKPITIPDELAAKCSGPDQFENFDKPFRSVIAVPKATVDKRETKWKKQRAKKNVPWRKMSDTPKPFVLLIDDANTKQWLNLLQIAFAQEKTDATGEYLSLTMSSGTVIDIRGNGARDVMGLPAHLAVTKENIRVANWVQEERLTSGGCLSDL
jgi:hypothetical protein